jgi:small subunit ribosomal protein S16
MAVCVRLERHGSKHRPFYHIVATDSRKKMGGEILERVGHYDPAGEPSKIVVDEARLRFWFERGAELSNTVAKIAKIQNVKLERAKTVTRAKKSK